MSNRNRTIELLDIAASAAKLLNQLDPVSRRKVIAAISRPWPVKHCQLIARLARYRVFHFDVTDSLRVCFRRINGRHCVIHVGTHSEFDSFAEHCDGNLPQQLLVMKDVFESEGNGQPRMPDSPSKTTTDLAMNVNQLNAAELLGQLVTESGAFHDQRRALDTMIEDMSLAARQGAINGMVPRFQDLEGRIKKNEDRLDHSISALRNDFAQRDDAMHEELRHLRSEHERTAGAQQQQTDRLEVADLRAELATFKKGELALNAELRRVFDELRTGATELLRIQQRLAAVERSAELRTFFRLRVITSVGTNLIRKLKAVWWLRSSGRN